MVEGNTQHRYKEAITLLEDKSPGTKSQFYTRFLREAADRFRNAEEATGGVDVVACVVCRAPTVRRKSGEPRCAFCNTKELALSRKPPRTTTRTLGAGRDPA